MPTQLINKHAFARKFREETLGVNEKNLFWEENEKQSKWSLGREHCQPQPRLTCWLFHKLNPWWGWGLAPMLCAFCTVSIKIIAPELLVLNTWLAHSLMLDLRCILQKSLGSSVIKYLLKSLVESSNNLKYFAAVRHACLYFLLLLSPSTLYLFWPLL